MKEAAASVYRCPSCGAPADPHAPDCSYCRAQLHPLRCPWCFAWGEVDAKDCGQCGAKAALPPEGARPEKCPTCRTVELAARTSGAARLAGCCHCGGVWADAASFKRLCDDRQAQSAYMGQGSVLPRPKTHDPGASPLMYRPCPCCAELMNRFNFAGCSGVILDACKPHGVWFDPEELGRIVQFIRGGGLDVARGKELEKLELERRRLERAQEDARRSPGALGAPPIGVSGIRAAGGLLEFLLK